MLSGQNELKKSTTTTDLELKHLNNKYGLRRTPSQAHTVFI